MLELIVEPGVRRTTADFLADPRTLRGIALDGYVITDDGEPWSIPERPKGYFPQGPRACLDHHKRVHRLSIQGMRSLYRAVTVSTQVQVHDLIKLGLLDDFRIDWQGEPVGNMFVQDSDGDVTPSVWQLWNYERFERKPTSDRHKAMLYRNDRIDRSTQGYPFDLDSQDQQINNWLFEAHYKARVNGGLRHASAETHRQIILDGCGRITFYMDGHEEYLPSNTDFDTLAEGPGWIVIHETGSQSRAHIFRNLGKELVLTFTPNGNGKNKITVAKRDPFIDYWVDHLFEELNQIEGVEVTSPNSWGGSSDSGGSGQMGTSLTLPEIVSVIPHHQGLRFGQTLNKRSYEPETWK